ncbi:uncharacterized protein [Montipora foliosa]|uniref:uncharacterized protein n=1 Tax=Montipora foliosa TaxID=591990 RepID=UPI0035F1FE85
MLTYRRLLPISSWKPPEARKQFRTNPDMEGKSSSGYCLGYLQANLAVLPSSLADDFEQFCQLNKAPCPLLYKSGIGEVTAGNLASDSDVRTDLQFYCVSENGIIAKEMGSLSEYSWNDYVSFYVGCSFSFEEALINSGIEIQNVTENRNVSMFTTNIQCVPVGPFSCPMVVSMRPIPKDQVEKAVVVTAAYDAIHGTPIHIGDPSVIGICNIYKPDFGDPSDIESLVPVFWACGVTSSLAVRSARPAVSFSHYPGSMFICDITVNDYFTAHKPEHGEEQPILVTLADHPYLASVCSASAKAKIDELVNFVNLAWESTRREDDLNNCLSVGDALMKVALRLSHAPSIVICFLQEKENFSSPDASASDCIQALLALVQAFQALDKKVTVLTPVATHLLQEKIAAYAASGHTIISNQVRVIKWNDSCDMKEMLYEDKINHRLDTIVALEAATKTENNKTEGKEPVDWFFEQVKSWNVGVARVKITTRGKEFSRDEAIDGDSHVLRTSTLKLAGYSLAAALYVLYKCPVHSRYVRRGIGKRKHFQIAQFLVEERSGDCSQIFDSVAEN